jgi:tRNA dimethylallyltransferase
MGPTGSGKSDFAEHLADRLGAQLVNGDAFQVYRGLDIGTAKPDDPSRYELLDLIQPDEDFGVGAWIQAAIPVLEACFARSQSVVLVGGTGLYIRALTEGYTDMMAAPDPTLRQELEARERSEGLESLVKELQEQAPEVAAKTDLRNPVRVRRALERLATPTDALIIQIPPFSIHKVALARSVDDLNLRIHTRISKMVQNGWVREVENLRAMGYGLSAPGFRAIGYRRIWNVISGEEELSEALTQIEIETRQYAKRQRSWLRAEPNLEVMTVEPDGSVRKLAESWLRRNEQNEKDSAENGQGD